MINKDKLKKEIKRLSEERSKTMNSLLSDDFTPTRYTNEKVKVFDIRIEVLESIYNCLD